MSAPHPAITADVSCRLVEVDFSGIEAVLTGWYLHRHGIDSDGGRTYIRMARLGIHAGVAALKAGDPVDWSWEDAQIKPHLKRIKSEHADLYDPAKRTVHANNFGMSTYGMVEKFPQFFPNLKVAEEFQGLYYALAPGLPTWHEALRRRAKDHHRLGGTTAPPTEPSIWDHPYGYRHWFWDVFSYRPCNEWTARKWLQDPKRAWRVIKMHGRWYTATMGGDANRVIAFYPQSTAAGRLKEAELDLFLPDSPDYIGDCYFGRTPLLCPVHDSLLLHIPHRCWDRVVETVIRVMQRPSERLPIPIAWGWGPYLPIGVSAKAGKNWAAAVSEEEAGRLGITSNVLGMEDIAVPTWTWEGVSHELNAAGQDSPVLPMDESEGEGRGAGMVEQWEDWRALERRVVA